MTKLEKIAELRSRAEHALRRSLSTLSNNEVPEVTNFMDTIGLHHLELELEIENLKQEKNKLKTEVDKYKKLFLKAPVAILTVNDSGVITSVNESAEPLFKSKITSLQGSSIFNYIHSESINNFDKKLNEAFISHKDQYGIIDLIDNSGNKHLVKTHLLVYKDKFNENDLCNIVFTDIEDENNVFEKELKEKEIAYQKLAADISEGIFDTKEGIIISNNQSFERILKYEPGELLGKDIRDLTTNCFRKLLNKILNEKDNSRIRTSYDIQFYRKDGSIFWAELKIIHYTEEGRTFGTISDISSRKRSEKELKRSERRLKTSNASKDKFFSILAHDLKTPFSTLNGYTYLLMKEYDDYDEEERKAIIKALYDSTKQTFNLLDNILVWARSQTGGLKFSPRNINISKLIIENISLYNATAKAKDITLSASVLNEIYGYADPEMIQTVLRNLISNAIKFTAKEGKINVSVDGTDKSMIKISVADNGMGISPENQAKLFRIDHNYSSPGTDDEKGTGLGLILCREFVMKNGGEIWMESTPGKGSTFHFTIKRHQD